MGDSIFKNLEAFKSIGNVSYYIGIDMTDIKRNAYCLVRNNNGVSEILMCKFMKSNYKFKQEVNNLSKYFNARIIEEIGK